MTFRFSILCCILYICITCTVHRTVISIEHFKVILITFKAIHGFAPKYISDLIFFKSESNYSLRSNDELLLSSLVVKALSTLGDRAFAADAPKLWNQLSEL